LAGDSVPGRTLFVEDGDVRELLERIKRELQLIFDVVSEAIMLVSRDMVIRRINRAGLAMSGKPTYAELLGRKCHQAIHGLSDPCPGCAVAAAFQEGRPQERELVRHIAGRTIYRRQRAFPLGPSLVVEVTEDVTEQRELREQTVRAEKLQAVMRLAGALAHEISQPLAAASGRAELLEMAVSQPAAPADPAELSRHVESLRGSCRRIAEIVRRLQGVSTYATKPYYGTEEIFDLDKAAGEARPAGDSPDEGKGRP
jgi:nitrogen-specific signal transduction histidine kinase